MDHTNREERPDDADQPYGGDHFERQLSRLMRQDRQPVSFEARHRDALRAGVRTRRRVRAARRSAGSVLAAAGLALGLFLWPQGQTDDAPTTPRPGPVTSPGPSPSATPTPSRSELPPETRGAPTGTGTNQPGPTGTTSTRPPSRTPDGPSTTAEEQPTPSRDVTTSAPGTTDGPPATDTHEPPPASATGQDGGSTQPAQ
ncbi:hypothetical protein [Streptomyces sp. NPDC088789]|uniref:hypothetical protein n=1 Tax=Streptomyces sp. NPDC088789 TaxID=3365899 RepID=UPI003813C00F